MEVESNGFQVVEERPAERPNPFASPEQPRESSYNPLKTYLQKNETPDAEMQD